MNKNSPYPWNTQRLGGIDQVLLNSDKSLQSLYELDPKLWVALSCPTTGLDFDARTLELIDTDHDGRIRVDDVKEAVSWTCKRLINPSRMITSPTELSIKDISTNNEESARLKETATAILATLGKESTVLLTQEDIIPATANVALSDFNGDGILPPLDSLDVDVRQYIADALSCIGGIKDSSGKAGINGEISEAFIQSLQEWSSWNEEVASFAGPIGTDTPEAWDLLQQLKEKIDDYFLRCNLAAFAPQSAKALNPDENFFLESEQKILSPEALLNLPLSHIEAFAPLNLNSGINPAWHGTLKRFFALVTPLLDTPNMLDMDAWEKLQSTFAQYATALAKKPQPKEITVTYAPDSSIEKLGSKRIKEILESKVDKKFKELADKDARVPAAAADIADVERLVLYHRHLYRLIKNFVNFLDFYTLEQPATFQIGTLYIDGRSCQLCLNVDDTERHAEMAKLSNMFLLYCECRRKNEDAADTPEEKMNIIAAVTAGDAELLLVGRNGLFVANQGEIWDATVTRVISNSINLRQAVWDPYRRLARLIEEQISKFASSKQDALLAKAEQNVNDTITSPPAQPSFDIGRNVGVFAAVGIALGAIGTAVGSIASALFSLAWWQLPLVFLGLFVIISGPSVIMAWLNLRKRSLGTILEASGWAVNSRLPISIPLASKLTSTAQLPENSIRNYSDPLSKKRNLPAWILFLFLLAGTCLGWLWYKGQWPSQLQFTSTQSSSNATAKSPSNATAKSPSNATAKSPSKATLQNGTASTNG